MFFLLVILNPSKFYPIIKERWKNAIRISNESEATSLAGFNIKFPLRMADDYKLQFGVVETTPDSGKHVLLYFSKNLITDSMKVNEFFIQKGIFLYYRKWVANPQKENSFEFHIREYLRALQHNKVEASEIIINGHKGIFGNQRDRLFHGYDIHDPSQVEFVMDNTHVTIQGYFSKDELIPIAQSIK